jgi:hypothetical protein
MSDEFFIGYLPKAPANLARFNRRTVIALGVATCAVGGALAATLPYLGAGVFEFGQHRSVTGQLTRQSAPKLVSGETEYMLVGYGKHAVPPEWCTARTMNEPVTLEGTLIFRDGTQLLEVSAPPAAAASGPGVQRGQPSAGVRLGEYTLTGEIVDSKCYFGVMNPAEGRVHRACAELCLRGGIPAVLIARDQTGKRMPVVLTDAGGLPINHDLLGRGIVAEAVKVQGEVYREGKWLVIRTTPKEIVRM